MKKDAERNILYVSHGYDPQTAYKSEFLIHGFDFLTEGITSLPEHVTFKTSIDNGTATQWNVTARQPLIHGERSAQSEQLTLGADAAEVEWLGARQELMLQVVESYFQLVVAERRQALLRRQLEAVERALAEAKDRYAAGDLPILDTHEATARARTGLGLGHVLLDRATRHELDHHESQQQHAQQGGQHEQDALEDVGQHRLGRGKDHKANNAQQENAYIRLHIVEQTKIDFQARGRRRFRGSHKNLSR